MSYLESELDCRFASASESESESKSKSKSESGSESEPNSKSMNILYTYTLLQKFADNFFLPILITESKIMQAIQV